MATKHTLKGSYKGYSGIDQKPFETDAQYYKRLAKAADQRLRRLEDLSEQEGFRHVKEWAYSNAMNDLEALFGSGVKRFDVSLPKTKQADIDLRSYYSRLNAVKRFLEAPTSSKTDIINVYKAKAEGVNKKYGTGFTWQQFAKYYTSGTAEKMGKLLGSKTALKVIGKMQQNKKQTIEAINKADATMILEDTPKAVADQVQKALKEEAIDPEIFK